MTDIECDMCFNENTILISICDCTSMLCLNCIEKLATNNFSKCISCQKKISYKEKKIQLIPLLSKKKRKPRLCQLLCSCFN